MGRCLSRQAQGRTSSREGAKRLLCRPGGVGTQGRCKPALRPCVKVLFGGGKPCGCCGKQGGNPLSLQENPHLAEFSAPLAPASRGAQALHLVQGQSEALAE